MFRLQIRKLCPFWCYYWCSSKTLSLSQNQTSNWRLLSPIRFYLFGFEFFNKVFISLPVLVSQRHKNTSSNFAYSILHTFRETVLTYIQSLCTWQGLIKICWFDEMQFSVYSVYMCNIRTYLHQQHMSHPSVLVRRLPVFPKKGIRGEKIPTR